MSTTRTGNMVGGFDGSSIDALAPEIRERVEQRSRLLGPAYKLFYDEPLSIARASGVFMYDQDDVEYLDAYNNVPSVGHGHPHVVSAVQRQVETLSTNTRYLTDGLIAYSERLLNTYPEAIDRVMFTCSGSEAVDLALRIARYETGGEGIVVTENAYHGVTAAAAEISPSLGANVPLGRTVWTVPAPNSAPGGGADVGVEFAANVANAIADMERHGIRFAAFIADSLFSTDGIIAEPIGVLRPVLDVVHSAAGLYIADEVQAGFARSGEAMWGFERHGIVPDIAVMGKPMGNGMPIAGLAAQARVLERFGTDIRYFNTFGGNTVSIAAADAVLDVLERERLLENSREVGAYLKRGMTEIVAVYEFLGAVRGVGLYLSADVFGDAGEPDARRAKAIINGMRRRRVLIGGTGKYGNSLKIRPLLPFTIEHADRFLEALDATVAEVARAR